MKKLITIIGVCIFGATVFFSIVSAQLLPIPISSPIICYGLWCPSVITGYLTTNPDPTTIKFSQQGMAGPSSEESFLNDLDPTDADNYIEVGNLRAIITDIPFYSIFPQLIFTQIDIPDALIDKTKKTITKNRSPQIVPLIGFVLKDGEGGVKFKVELSVRQLEAGLKKPRFVRKIIATTTLFIPHIDTGEPDVQMRGFESYDNEYALSSITNNPRAICAKNTIEYEPPPASGRYLRRCKMDPYTGRCLYRNDITPIPIRVNLAYSDTHEPYDSKVAAVKFTGDIMPYWTPPFTSEWKPLPPSNSQKENFQRVTLNLTPGPGFKIIGATVTDNALNFRLGSKLPGHLAETNIYAVEVVDCPPGHIMPPSPIYPLANESRKIPITPSRSSALPVADKFSSFDSEYGSLNALQRIQKMPLDEDLFAGGEGNSLGIGY